MRRNASATEVLPSDAASRSRAGRWKAVVAIVVVVTLLVAFVGGIAIVWISSGLERAQQSAKQRRWEEASSSVSQYLRIWPHDSEARLLAAEVLYRRGSGSGNSEAAVRESLGHLEWIPDESREGPEARLRAAGMLLTVLKRPHAAELQLRRAIKSDPKWIEPYLLLWRILDATGRSDFAEPTVREVIRLAPPDQRIAHLRSWYLSQFAPAAANLELDYTLGVVEPNEIPNVATEAARYDLFRTAEPDSPIHVAAAARLLLLRKSQAQQAAEMLEAFDREHEPSNTFFAAVRAEATFNAGDIAAFEEVMRQWPEPREGYDFNKWEGVRLEEIADDPAAAVVSYRKALEVWPGHVDWQVVFRLSTCLRRLGQTKEADQLKARSDELGKLIVDDYHRPLREALVDLSDPRPAEQAAELYDRIGRPWEAGLWREHAATLRQNESAAPQDSTNVFPDSL